MVTVDAYMCVLGLVVVNRSLHILQTVTNSLIKKMQSEQEHICECMPAKFVLLCYAMTIIFDISFFIIPILYRSRQNDCLRVCLNKETSLFESPVVNKNLGSNCFTFDKTLKRDCSATEKELIPFFFMEM